VDPLLNRGRADLAKLCYNYVTNIPAKVTAKVAASVVRILAPLCSKGNNPPIIYDRDHSVEETASMNLDTDLSNIAFDLLRKHSAATKKHGTNAATNLGPNYV
jgi:hypothetical protein